jgi:ubiquinol-cytochrome c reductase iron-sulfur subunit
VGSWFPSAKAKAAGAPVKVNISKIEPGQQMIAEWRGQPVFIVRRTEEILGNLKKIEGQLSDPDPRLGATAYVDPKCARSSRKSSAGRPLHPPGLLADLPSRSRARRPGPKWVGGYFCPCHGSHYDLAGRVYKSQPAPLNLPVPPHSYETDDLIVIGVDQEKA